MRSYSFNRMSWAIFLCLLSSTFVTVEIAKGNEHDQENNAEASLLEDLKTEPEDVVATDTETTETEAGTDAAPTAEETSEDSPTTTADEPAADPETEAGSSGDETTSEPEPETEAAAAEPEPESSPAPAPAPAPPTCDVSSVSTTLSEKIEQLQKKVESLVSQLTGDIESKVSDLKETVSSKPQSCPTPAPSDPAPAAPAEKSDGDDHTNGNEKLEKIFESCLESLSANNLPEAVSHWELIEKQTFGPTAKATLLKDILFLAYDKSKATCAHFVNELLKSSKKYLPPVFDVLQEAMKLNSDNLFSLASTIKTELGTESSLYQKLPAPVQAVTSGKPVKLTFQCKTLQKKLEVHVRDDEMTWEREYWPVVASNAFNLNHTKGALWSFESTSSGNFHLKNSWFGDYLWIEPNYQNLRTVDESTKSRNATEFKITLNSDSTVNLLSTFYKDAPVTEGYHTRNTRDSFRPLRVDHDHTAIKFSIEPTGK